MRQCARKVTEGKGHLRLLSWGSRQGSRGGGESEDVATASRCATGGTLVFANTLKQRLRPLGDAGHPLTQRVCLQTGNSSRAAHGHRNCQQDHDNKRGRPLSNLHDPTAVRPLPTVLRQVAVGLPAGCGNWDTLDELRSQCQDLPFMLGHGKVEVLAQFRQVHRENPC